MRGAAKWVRDRCASEAFFWGTLTFFAINGALIALAADMYMLYDERYHVGIIDAYSRQWSPIISDGSQNVGLGDTERLASYLYHFLMSFPYRVVNSLGFDHVESLMVLRLINVGLVAAACIWFRRTLRLMGISRASANVSIAVFTLIPVVVFVAATVNYDNLMLLVGALFFWHTVKIVTSRDLAVRSILIVLSLACLGSITKYTFLLIAATTVALLAVHELRRSRAIGIRTRWRTRERIPAKWTSRIALATLVTVSFGLFVERIMRNVWDYGTPRPDCARIHSEQFCQTYDIWQRNAELSAAPHDSTGSVGGAATYFFIYWMPGMFRSATQMGGETLRGTQNVKGPDVSIGLLWVAAVIAVVLIVLAAAAARRNTGAVVLATVVVAFICLTFGANYSYFLSFGQPLAVQARYFIIILPFVIAAAVGATAWVLDRTQENPPTWKLAGLAGAVLVATQGGGALSYVALSDASWFGPHSVSGELVNTIRPLVSRLMIGV